VILGLDPSLRGTGYGVIFQITTNGALSTPVVLDGTNGANSAALAPGRVKNYVYWLASLAPSGLRRRVVARYEADQQARN
jgi:hypothetical protein